MAPFSTKLPADILRGADQAKVLDNLEANIENLRATFRADGLDETALAANLRLAAVLWRFWYARGRLVEGCTTLAVLLRQTEKYLASIPTQPSRQFLITWSEALNAAGRLESLRGDFDRAK